MIHSIAMLTLLAAVAAATPESDLLLNEVSKLPNKPVTSSKFKNPTQAYA